MSLLHKCEQRLSRGRKDIRKDEGSLKGGSWKMENQYQLHSWTGGRWSIEKSVAAIWLAQLKMGWRIVEFRFKTFSVYLIVLEKVEE